MQILTSILPNIEISIVAKLMHMLSLWWMLHCSLYIASSYCRQHCYPGTMGTSCLLTMDTLTYNITGYIRRWVCEIKTRITEHQEDRKQGLNTNHCAALLLDFCYWLYVTDFATDFVSLILCYWLSATGFMFLAYCYWLIDIDFLFLTFWYWHTVTGLLILTFCYWL